MGCRGKHKGARGSIRPNHQGTSGDGGPRVTGGEPGDEANSCICSHIGPCTGQPQGVSWPVKIINPQSRLPLADLPLAFLPSWITTTLNTAKALQTADSVSPCAAFVRQETASNRRRVERGVDKGHTCSCAPPVCAKTNDPRLPSLLCRDYPAVSLLHRATCQTLLKPISHLFKTQEIWWKLAIHV